MDRIRFGVIILVVFSIAFAVQTASAAKLKVPTAGQYIYWIDYTDSDGKPQATSPEKFKGKSVDVDLAQLGTKYSDAELTVLDLETGNAAVKLLPQGKESADVTLTPDDFQLVRTVEISITSKDGKPVESAAVTLTDAANVKMTQMIDPTSLGIVRFSNVAAGQVTVSALYEGRKKVWDIEIPADREEPVFSTALKISGKVSTVTPPQNEEATVDAGAARTRTVKADAKTPGFVSLLYTMMSLLLLAVIVVIIYLFVKARGVTAESALKKLGVSVPEGGDAADFSAPASSAPAAPQVDPSTCQFCGQKKDAAGNCACSVIGSPSVGSAAAGNGEPRLIGTQGAYAGTIFPIRSDMISIGREETNTVALPQDSTASRRHATISRSNGDFTIRDEGSSNGTYVNGARIAASTPLRPGDEVQIGSSKFRFETS